MLISLLLSLNLIWAQQQELPTIDIEAENALISAPRSIDWPLIEQAPQPSINSTQITDAVNTINGVQSREQGSPTFSIRGSGQSGRALVLYNDIPINFATGFGAPSLLLPKELIGNFSLVKGPASLFYGSQALAGAINFQPRLYKSGRAVLTVSDSDESFLPWRDGGLAHNSLHVARPFQWSENSITQISFFNETDDGAFSYQTPRGSGVRQFNAQNQWRSVLGGAYKSKRIQLKYDAIIGKQIRQTPGPLNFPIPTREESDALLVSVAPEVFLSPQSTLQHRVSFLKQDSDFLDSSGNTFNNSQTLILQNQYMWKGLGKTSFQMMADFFFHQLDNSFSGNDLKQDQWELAPIFTFYSTEKLEHQLGVRYLGPQERALPSVLLRYHTTRNRNLWLSYSEGFRNPSLSDLYSRSPFFLGNPNLTPETSRQWELGVLSRGETPLAKWSTDVRIFRIDYDNFLESFETTPGVFTRTNRGKGFSQGLDLFTQVSHMGNSVQFSYNYLDSEDDQSGQAFRLSPKHQLSWGALFPRGPWQFQFRNVHWYDTYDYQGTTAVKLEDWQQWDFYLHYRPSDRVRVSFGLINAFDEGKELTLNYPEPERRYWLQVRLQR